jgi:glucan-binding YG repeat protein
MTTRRMTEEQRKHLEEHADCYTKEAIAILEEKHWEGKNKCVKLPGDEGYVEPLDAVKLRHEKLVAANTRSAKRRLIDKKKQIKAMLKIKKQVPNKAETKILSEPIPISINDKKPKTYKAKSISEVKRILRVQKAEEYSTALDQLAEVWG